MVYSQSQLLKAFVLQKVDEATGKLHLLSVVIIHNYAMPGIFNAQEF